MTGADRLERSAERYRSPAHRRFVKSLRCIVCGAHPPNDPHHLKFLQLRAMQLKAGDQWCVPLCRPHHNEAERNSGKEEWWWNTWLKIDPVPLAQELWAISIQAGRATEVL